MTNTIQVKRGANASLPVLNAGEFGFSTDTHQTYIGDGAANHELAGLDASGKLKQTQIPNFETLKVSSTVANSLGGYVRKFAEATETPPASATYFDIPVDVPIGCKLLGCQLRVDTALAVGETWGAAYTGGSTTALAAAGQAVAKNTKISKIHVDEISTNTVRVRISKDAGEFSPGEGIIRAIVYYETFTAMGDAV